MWLGGAPYLHPAWPDTAARLVHPCSTCLIALAQLTLLRDFVSDDFTLFETVLFTLFETDLILSESGIRPIEGVGLEIRPFPLSVRD